MKLETVDLKKIKIQDAFWSKHIALVKEAIIPYQWDAMNDLIPDAEPSHCLENFKLRQAEKTESFTGQFSRIQILQNGWRQLDSHSLIRRMMSLKKERTK